MRKGLWLVGVLACLHVLPVSAQARREMEFPDVPGLRTLKCDFHMHTVFSDGSVWPTVRVEEAWREGYDAIAITDHIEYQPHKKDVPTNHNRPHELAKGMAAERNILLVRGAEITRETPPGHFNALFTTDNAALDVKDFDEQFRIAHEQGAFVFWNHPGWQGEEKGRWGPEQTRLHERKWMQGIEVANDDMYEARAFAWAIEKDLAVLGNSDIHGPSDACNRNPQNHRTVTLVFAKGKTLDDLREALLAGRTAVWCRNQMYGREQNLAPLFAACVQVGPAFLQSGKTLSVEVRNRCEMDIELVGEGGVKPAKISLPARTTTLVRFEASPEAAAAGLAYRVVNWLVGPDKPLGVKLVVPKPAAQSRPAAVGHP